MLAGIHPIDPATLKKGTWLGTEDLEWITGLKRDDRRFKLAVLSFRDWVQKETGILCREERDCLRLMTDSEAVYWIDRNFNRHASGIARCFARTGLVDTSGLTDGEKKHLEINQNKYVGTCQAINGERRRELRARKLLALAKGSPE